MKVAIIRDPSKGGATLGNMISEDGGTTRHIGWTLEDEERDDEFVAGETCLPKGMYWMRVTHSPRFNRDMVQISDTETGYQVVTASHTYSGVRVHGGNKAEDTDGCVLLGASRDKPGRRISNCGAVNAELVRIVEEAGLVELEIR